MAGETPGASKHSKRRKLPWNQDKSTNKIYASDQVSALGKNQTVADSVKRAQKGKVGNPTPTQKADDKSADKYYANGGSARVRGPAGGVKRAAAPVAGKPAPVSTPKATVNTKDGVTEAIEAIVERLQSGETGITVYVPAGNADLLKRMRAALELQVTRESITEAQYREVRLSYAMSETPPTPIVTKTVDVPSTVDPLAFLSGAEDIDDPVIDTSPLPATESTAQNLKTGEVAEPNEDEDEGDNDFLKPTPVVFEAPAVEHTPPEPVEEVVSPVVEAPPVVEEPKAADPVAEETLPKRRGKRSGRGSD